MLTLNNVSTRYNRGKWALENLSFGLALGEMAFLTGASGAGKSTILKMIALLQPYTSGQIMFDGLHLNSITENQIPFYRRQIGIIFQTPQLLNDRSVFNNVAFPLIIAGHPYKEIASKVRAALDKVGLLRMEDCLPSILSGGEQQRVGIARAIVHKPALILADEPTGNLDHNLSLDIMRVFQQLNQVGVTILVATHNLSMVNQLPFRNLVLTNGKINSHVA